MALHERSDQTILKSVSRLVSLRWPGDHVLLAIPCEVERVPGRAERLLGVLGRTHCPGGSCTVDTSHLHEPAFLSVTSTRLIYQGRRSHGIPLRVMSVALAALALYALLGDGGRPAASVMLALAAAVAWFAATLAQAFGVRSGTLEFRRVLEIDRADQRLDGVGRWGTLYRVRVSDADDFRLVAAMVEHSAG
jgi:hypothetical protein